MDKKPDVSINKVLNELLATSIFKNVAERNNPLFARKLAMWLIRYVLVASSMKESLKTPLETILLDLHGDRFKKIINITEKTFRKIDEDSEISNRYIW